MKFADAELIGIPHRIVIGDRALAEGVAGELGLFDRVLASRPGHNLKASHKASALVELYGEGGFDYAGNSHADLPVWARCAQAIVVNPDRGVMDKLSDRTPTPQLIGPPSPGWSGLFRALRP